MARGFLVNAANPKALVFYLAVLPQFVVPTAPLLMQYVVIGSTFVAADVVVTNAGGATVLEALMCGRAVVLHNPIAGHGRANAALLAEAGLVRVCAKPGELAHLAGEFAQDRSGLDELEARALRYGNTHDVGDGLLTLAAVARGAGRYPVG